MITESGIRVADGGDITLAKSWGMRRLKAMLLISQSPELDDPEWSGHLEIHFGGHSVKGQIVPALRELNQ